MINISSSMTFLVFNMFAFLCLRFVASHAAIEPSEVYWKSVLPSTPIPKTLRDLLHPPEWINEVVGKVRMSEDFGSVVSNNQALEEEDTGARKSIKVADLNNRGSTYAKIIEIQQLDQPPNSAVSGSYITYAAPMHFLKKDMAKGTKRGLHYSESKTPLATFLPHQAAQNLPFSSSKFLEALEYLSIKPGSKEAEAMRATIKLCEEPGLIGEEKYCATSLESMVDFTTSKLGGKVNAVSTESNRESDEMQEYAIVGVKRMGGSSGDHKATVTCHKRNYAYALFYCHKTVGSEAYVVSMVGDDGAKANAVAVCHTNTSGWDPNYRAFQVLNIKPGTVPFRHFLPRDHVIWVPY